MTSDDDKVYMSELRPDHLIARASDFLHHHSVYADIAPQHLSEGVQEYIMHLAEHLTRYMGVLPPDYPFLTDHLDNELLKCDDNYMPFMSTEEMIKRASEITRRDALVEEAIRTLLGGNPLHIRKPPNKPKDE